MIWRFIKGIFRKPAEPVVDEPKIVLKAKVKTRPVNGRDRDPFDAHIAKALAAKYAKEGHKKRRHHKMKVRPLR